MKHLSGAPPYGRPLTLPTNNRLGWDKRSSLLQKFVTYGRLSFIRLENDLGWPRDFVDNHNLAKRLISNTISLSRED